MLRKIAPDEVVLGMYIHGFEGSWISHPFWRSRFLLAEPDDVARVRASAVRSVIIDSAKGVDRTEPAEKPAEKATSLRDRFAEPALNIDFGPAMRRALARQRSDIARPRPRPARPPSAPPAGPCSAAEEYQRAAKIVDNTKRAVMSTFTEARLGKAVQSRKLVPLVDQITASVERNGSALLSIARLKSKHDYTYMHSVAVCTMMINLARHLKLSEEQVREAGLAGLLHDIGKMAVPVELLDKPGRLTDDEFALIKQHPSRGAALLQASEGLPPAAHDVCLHHHERYDGQGYPGGLHGDRISLYSRMAAICDVYDAVTSDRAYKPAWSPAEGLTRMLSWQGHFDAEILAGFTQSIGIYPIGGLVRLRSERLAIVVGENVVDPLHPPVRAFYSTQTRQDVPPENVPTEKDDIIELQRPEDWALKGWKARRQRLLAESDA